MVDRNQQRQDGSTGGDEERDKLSKEFHEPATAEVPEDRIRRFGSTGFSRMRTDWRGDDRQAIRRAQKAIDLAFDRMFGEALRIMYDVYAVVREPVLVDGEPKLAEDGFPEWQRNSSGSFVENWSKLTSTQRERFLFQITTRLFEWEQSAADIWGEAMFAKALWEDAFSVGYESLEGSKPTINDRTARGNLMARDDRYFALFVSTLSRKAEALVRTMTLLSQRLKDVHTGVS